MNKTAFLWFNLILFALFSPLQTSNCFAGVINLDGSFFVLSTQQIPENKDNDHDGFTPAQGDCNDNNPIVHPGAVETCGDGIDHDCNGNDMDCPLRTVEDKLLALINQERNDGGLPTLQRDPALDRVIHWHVNNMATDHFLNHVDKNGRRAESRVNYYGGDSSYRCLEIIGWWGGPASGNVHYNGYRNSPSHHSAYMEEGLLNLGPTSYAGVSTVAGTGPVGSQYERKDGSYSAVFLCDRPLHLIIDPFSED